MDMDNTKSTMTIKPDLGDYRGLLKALSAMDKDSQGKLKNDVASISAWTAGGIKTSAYVGARFPAQAAIVAATVRPARDRVPTVYIGGGKGRASGGANAGQLLFGNEFGGNPDSRLSVSGFPNGGYKFPARSPREGRGNKGYWIFPTLKVMQPEIKRRWQEACVKVLDNWARTS
jgi:hypothetical protein